MSVRKSFRLAISKKFVDGSIISATFGTELEKEIDDAKAQELFSEVYNGTMLDMQTSSAVDPRIFSILDSIHKMVQQEAQVNASIEAARQR